MAPALGQIWLLNLHYEVNELKTFQRNGRCGEAKTDRIKYRLAK